MANEQQGKQWVVAQGDCLEVMRGLPAASVDAMITDPPSGAGLFDLEWDAKAGGRDAWIDWLRQVMVEALRILKPGAHALVWSYPRTSHWTAWALENAGFELRPPIVHVYGSGQLKSMRRMVVALPRAAG
jgi:site-specific DNA-methyltransferase (adenine-specific)